MSLFRGSQKWPLSFCHKCALGHSIVLALSQIVFFISITDIGVLFFFIAGHEAAFAAFLCCLCKVGVLRVDDQLAIIFKVFDRCVSEHYTEILAF